VMVLLGYSLSITTETIPSFLMAVGILGSIHIVAVFYQALARDLGRDEAIAYSLGHSGLPVVMASITTAGGLLSFAGADIAHISQLGVIAPIGVMIALAYSLVLLPALVAIVPHSRRQRAGPRHDLLVRLLCGAGEASARRPLLVLAVAAGAVALGVWGMTRLRVSHNELTWFPEKEPGRIATELVDRELRGVLTLEVVVDTGRENGLHSPDLLQRMDRLAAAAETLRNRELAVGKTLSLVDILKETHRALNENLPAFYAIPGDRRLVAQELLLFENSGSDDLEEVVDSQFSKARVSMKIPWVDAMLYPEFLAEIQRRFDAIIGDEARVEITGLGAIFGRTLAAVVETMMRSYVISLALIMPMMIFLVGHLWRGTLNMLPNLIPVLLTLGLMGWLGIAIDISTLLIGPIIIGLADDDTIHFIHQFNHYYHETGDPYHAVRETLRTTGVAMFIASVVLAAGFGIFGMAYLVNVSSFGLLAAFATVTAFLAHITVSPALMILATRSARAESRLPAGALPPG